MNKGWVVFHLKESSDELQKIIRALERDSVTDEEFEIGLSRAYHHLNTAWNSRSISDEQARDHTDWDFAQWRQFPKELK
jgi:hypothetical protein